MKLLSKLMNHKFILVARIMFIAQIVVLTTATLGHTSNLNLPTFFGSKDYLAEMTTMTNNLQFINNEKGVVVCDENIDCDNDLVFEWPDDPKIVTVITSSESNKRFNVTNTNSSHNEARNNETSKLTSLNINLNLNDKRQPIMGWGGAFTDATCYHITKASSALADKLIASLYGPKGLDYNFGRVPIAGSDFSLRPYTYDDTENNQPDYNLENWSLAPEDLEYKIPVIQRAMQISDHRPIKLFASPWSPPAWMKTNNDIKRGHLIYDDVTYSAYAKYLIKFFDAYREEGLEFWGATVQNEPTAAYFPFYFFNSLQFSPAEISKFIGKFYGPALKASNRTKENFKLMIGDDSLGFVNYHVPTVMKDPEASQYISGLAFHWYTSKSIISYNHLNTLYDEIKDKIEFVMMSEACTGSVPTSRGVRLGDWTRGEQYALDIIEDLARHTSAWIDWNMVLDLQGGPNWSGNFVDSPIIVDNDKKLFYKQPMYYALAHFSRLFLPNCDVLVPFALNGQNTKGLSYIGCHIKTTNHVVVNIVNSSSQEKSIFLSIDGEPKTSDIKIDPKSITSVLIKM